MTLPPSPGMPLARLSLGFCKMGAATIIGGLNRLNERINLEHASSLLGHRTWLLFNHATGWGREARRSGSGLGWWLVSQTLQSDGLGSNPGATHSCVTLGKLFSLSVPSL